MHIVFHSRNANLADDFRDIASEKLKALSRFSVMIEEMKVEVKHEPNPRFGKSSHVVILTSHGCGPFMRADGEAFNDLAAFDLAVASFELQIRKVHERTNDYDHGRPRGIAL